MIGIVRKYIRLIYNHTIASIVWNIHMTMGKTVKTTPSNPGSLAVFDSSIGTDNTGDEIIMDYCGQRIRDALHPSDFISIPIQKKPTKNELIKAGECGYKIICGTNLLFRDMGSQIQWRFGTPFSAYKDMVLLGVGWHSYDDRPITQSTIDFYRTYLNDHFYHSVRDEYTKKKLNEIGIENVLNTACPTMWDLTAEKCSRIPTCKADKVVTTLTDYNRAPNIDRFMLEKLKEHYAEVYIWIQGDNDFEYLESLGVNGIKVIEQSLSTYDNFLKKGKCEYIGTRLHAGIRALNFEVRTMILGVDNRALEISRDTGLPVIPREKAQAELERLILDIRKTEIKLPIDSINLWRNQFANVK